MISHPEFWTSLAFVLIVILALRPVGRTLKKWTLAEDEKIQQARDEVEALCQKAEELRAGYEKAYMTRFDTKEEKMKEAEQEIALLKKEVAKESEEKTDHVNQEMSLRLKMIEETGLGNLKKQLVDQVVSETQKKLAETHIKENADFIISEAFEALDSCYQHD